MKIALREINGLLNKPPRHVLVYLIYGRDEGLVHETASKIASKFVDDLNDPFNVSELSGNEVLSNPSKLIDEATAQSLVGGQRVVRVLLGSENISESISTLLNLSELCALIILEAGNMKASSPVRRLLETHPDAAVVPCYQDNQNALTELIFEVMVPFGVTVSRPAVDYLLSHLGSDRMVSRRELEKLALYVGNNNEVSLENAISVVGDSSALDIEQIVFSATSGKKDLLSVNLTRAVTDGIPPISLLRATQNHMQRLLLAHARLVNGKTPTEAIKSLRPPVLFMFTKQFRNQLVVWKPTLIFKALGLLTNAEALCKSTGFPDRAVCERVLLQVAQMARTAN